MIATSEEMKKPGTSRFHLELFGHLRLRGPRGEISLSPLQWALVAMTFGRDDALSRPRLLQLLWPRGAESVLLRRLSQLIYSLDLKVGESILHRSASSLRPNDSMVETDLSHYVSSIDGEEFGAAWRVLDRGFLRGLPLAPTRECEEWVDRRSASLRSDLRDAATSRWCRAEREGLWTQRTLDAADALHKLSPSDEGSLRRAMWARALVQTPLEAMATYESFLDRNGLTGHGDVEAETLTLFERVKALSKQPRSGTSEKLTPSRADPTLFGRDAELALLRPILSGVVKDGLTVVQVRGAAGLGKSRLVNECLGPAALQGRLVLRARLAELERDIPLNALIEAFAAQETAKALEPLDEPWRSLLLHLMPDFTAVVGPALPIPPVQSASLQRRLLEAVRLLMDQVVRDRPVVLFLDDFQWVDDSSLAALEYLRRRWSTGCAVLVVNVRPEDVEADSNLESFLDGDGTIRVDLDELDDVSQKQLVREVCQGEIPSDVLARLQVLGGGNPLFLIELARQWQDGQLQLPSWAGDEIRLPVSIQQLYEQRFRRLSTSSMRVLQALTVWGKSISAGDVAAMAGLGSIEATEGLEELDSSGLLRWHADGVELWHGLIRQAVLSRLSEARRRWLHLQAAEFLRTTPEPELEELALHFDRGRKPGPALEYSLSVANNAERVGAVTEALRFLEIAARNAGKDKNAYSIQARLANLLHLRCAYDEAQALYSRIESAGVEVLSPSEYLRARVRGLDCAAHNDRIQFDPFLAANRTLRREAYQRGMFEIASIALASAVHHMQRANRVEAADELLKESKRCALEGSPRAQCRGNQLAAGLTLLSGEGGAYARVAVELAREHGLQDLAPGVGAVEVAAWLLSGRLGTAEGVAVQKNAIDAAEQAGDLMNHVRILNNIGAFYLDVGELAVASGFLDRVRALGGGSIALPEDLHVRMNLGELALGEGDQAGAEELFGSCLPERVGGVWHGWGVAHAGLGLCCLEKGRVAEASEHEVHMRHGMPSSSPFPVDQSICAEFAARLAVARQDLDGALALLERAESRLRGTHVPHFLRVRVLRVRLARRAGSEDTYELAEEGYEMARRLGLGLRAAYFGGFRVA